MGSLIVREGCSAQKEVSRMGDTPWGNFRREMLVDVLCAGAFSPEPCGAGMPDRMKGSLRLLTFSAKVAPSKLPLRAPPRR